MTDTRDAVTEPGDAPTPPVGSYRVGSRNPRNIYRAGINRDTDEHVAVAFTPEMGRLIVLALKAVVDGAPDG